MAKIYNKIKSHKIAAGLLLLFLALVVVRFVTGPENSSAAKPAGQRPIYVELGQATFGTMREVGQYYGTLNAAQKFSVSPKVGGELKRLMVDIGDRIESGQVLAMLDDDQYRLARDQAAHNVGLAEAQYAEAEANLSLAKSDLARQASLVGKRITPQSEYEAYENKLRQAEARLMLAASQLSGARSQLADAALRLSYTTISATWPEDGYRWVGERLVDEGDLLTANTPLLAVVSLNPLLVVVEVIERDYPKIKIGQEAELRTEAWPGEVFKGRVVRVAPVLSSNTRQARVELEVANDDLKLKPGMFTEVLFVFQELLDVWSVPEDVPFRRSDGFVIFVADPKTETVKMQPVDLGLSENGRVQLVDVPPIDGPIVVLGQYLLEDGLKYKAPGASGPRGGNAPPQINGDSTIAAGNGLDSPSTGKGADSAGGGR
ncbi:efflux RND transporter periplasmic adaptor subunit [Deltaproteobacteria bacterium OttesenSCG-928-K17]|nr:efflux RND transporter periplasmic adaptor subunit [Deltaproteobacteria bacterium OttesenSCG-928-K17]